VIWIRWRKVSDSPKQEGADERFGLKSSIEIDYLATQQKRNSPNPSEYRTLKQTGLAFGTAGGTGELCAHSDNDLAKGAPPKVFISFARLVERINLVYDWMDLMLVEEVVHPFECAGWGNGDAADCSLPEDDPHQIEVRSLAL
jgi:hypothetical protein